MLLTLNHNNVIHLIFVLIAGVFFPFKELNHFCDTILYLYLEKSYFTNHIPFFSLKNTQHDKEEVVSDLLLQKK